MDNTPNTEPKPCPFCGAEAELTSGYFNDLQFARVDCTECLAGAYADSDRFPGKTSDELEEMVIAAWNRRVDNG